MYPAIAARARADRGRIGKANVSVNGIDANAAKVLRFDWKRGSDTTIGSLGAHGAILKQAFATKHHLAVGDADCVSRPKAQRKGLSREGTKCRIAESQSLTLRSFETHSG